MPATSHALTDLPPRHLYLDTNFYLSHLVSTDVHHQAATDFFVHLATCNVTTLYISSLSWLEFVHVVSSAEWRAQLPSTWQAQYQLYQLRMDCSATAAALLAPGLPWHATAYGSDQADLILHRWQDAPVRQAYLKAMRAWLEQLLQAYPWAEIDLTSAIAQRALQYVEQYNLDTHDAAHWASAEEAGVMDLASFDRGFRRVDGLHLWTL